MLQKIHVFLDSSFYDGFDLVADPGRIFPDIFRTWKGMDLEVQKIPEKILQGPSRVSNHVKNIIKKTHVLFARLSSSAGLLEITCYHHT